MAKACVEPYGMLVQINEFETEIRIKPECQAIVDAQHKPAVVSDADGSGASAAELSAGTPASPGQDGHGGIATPRSARAERKAVTASISTPTAARALLASCDQKPNRLIEVEGIGFQAVTRPECERQSIAMAEAVLHPVTVAKAEPTEPKVYSGAAIWVDYSGAWDWQDRNAGAPPVFEEDRGRTHGHGPSAYPAAMRMPRRGINGSEE